MFFFDYLLYNALQQFDEIIVYGTGWFASKLYPMLCKNQIKEKIICFAVSVISEKKYGEFEVKEISKIQCNKEKTVVLTAVSELYQNEVTANSRAVGFIHIMKATDYIRSDENMMRFYNGMSYVGFIECILQRHMYDYPKEKENCQSMKERLLENVNYQDFDESKIVYITGHLSSRNIKMINALKKKGYSVITIVYNTYRQEIFLGEMQYRGIYYIECEDEEEMMFHALRHRPLVYYYEPLWGNCIWMELILQYKAHFRPIVLGLYDVLNDGYVLDNQTLLESERYALENADGVVWRYFSKEYLEEKKGFSYKGKSIQFLDYCGGYVKEKRGIEHREKDVLKLCCVWGCFNGFSNESDMPDGYESVSSLKEITNVLGNNKNVTLHIYIAVSDPKSIAEARKIEKEFLNIKFYWNVAHDELIERLQQYDYGCEFYNKGRAIPMDMPVKCGSGMYYGSAYINSVSNRYFDYIDAGLAIVISASYKQIEFLSAYDVIVPMSLQNLDINFLKDNVIDFKRKAIDARQKLNIDNHIQRLIDFFKKC